MKKVYKYKKKLLLEQGNYYNFKFNKIIISPDMINYYIVTDKFDNKHLIPVKDYTDYNLIIGNSYLCKVDKINCLGRIFIEPPHPIYKENEEYLFKFSKTIKIKHKSGTIYSYYKFLGNNKYDAFLDADNNTLNNNLKLGLNSFKIKSISKGKIYLSIS